MGELGPAVGAAAGLRGDAGAEVAPTVSRAGSPRRRGPPGAPGAPPEEEQMQRTKKQVKHALLALGFDAPFLNQPARLGIVLKLGGV
jgi:hypothetical protein